MTDNILCATDIFSFFFFVLAELEFVQIIIIIVVITVMVVVIICLLNHYKLSTRSFINRQSQSRRQEETLQTVSTSPLHQIPSRAAKPPEGCGQLLEELVWLLILFIVRSFAEVVFVSRKKSEHKWQVYCLWLFLNCMFYVAYLHFAFGGSDPVYCCCNWKGSGEDRE